MRKIILRTLSRFRLLTAAVILTVAGAVIVSLLPPLVLERIINELTQNQHVPAALGLEYFALLALAGVLTACRESLLTVLGQKITHSMRSALLQKLDRLPADRLVRQDPGATVSRFVGDVDTVEDLFTSGIISMFADACQMVSIFVILFLRNRGLTRFFSPCCRWSSLSRGRSRSGCCARRSTTGLPWRASRILSRRPSAASGPSTISAASPICGTAMRRSSVRATGR